MRSEQWNANMLYKDAFQSATVLKLGGVVTFISSSLFSVAPASAIPTISLMPRQLRPSGERPPVVSEYTPPHARDQPQPTNHETTKPTSGRADNHREPPSGTGSNSPGSEGEGNFNYNQAPNELEAPDPNSTVPTELKTE